MALASIPPASRIPRPARQRRGALQLPRVATDVFVLIACDGLWDVLENPEALALVQRGLHAGRSCAELGEELVKLAFERGSQDNVSVVLARIGDASAEEPASDAALAGEVEMDDDQYAAALGVAGMDGAAAALGALSVFIDQQRRRLEQLQCRVDALRGAPPRARGKACWM